MTAHSCTARGLLAFVLVFAMLTSLGGGLPAAAGPAPQANDLRISQVYGGGGNSGAPYTHDFIEIFNAGAAPISLNGMSVQYASATGTGNFGGTATQITELPAVMLGPGQYYLIQEAGGTTGSPLPTPDHIDTTPINLSGTGGKVILANTAATLGCNGGSTPCSAAQLALIVDLVGYGAANFFEGTGAAPTLSNTTAALRAGGGCTDTDDNAADFSADAPTPRNTSSPTNSCSVDNPPAVVSTIPVDGAIEAAVNALVSVTFSEPVTISGAIAIDCTNSGVQNVIPSGGPITFALPHSDFDLGDSCTVTILASQVADLDGTPTNMVTDYDWTFGVTYGCFGPATPIHTIQGNGLASPLIGQPHAVEGVVIADFQTVSSIRGFYIQTPDGEDDGDPATSQGLFIYDNNLGVPVAAGDYVRVAGFVSEFQQQTQLSSVFAVTNCDTNPLTVTPTLVTLPFPNTAYPERFEGMSVVMTQTLTVSENFNLGRGGLVTLSNGRLQQPTNVVLPGAAANALQAANNLNQIVMDDGNLAQNPDPIIYPPPELTALNTLRSDDQVTDIVAVFSEGGSGWANTTAYRIHPLEMPTFTFSNPRPLAPNPVRAGGSLKVSAFNVLNYFLTIDDRSNNCGPDQNMNCRGADSTLEFDRQRAKLLQALSLLNADVVGLMELENTPGVEPLQDLVDGLNDLVGAGTYDFIDAGTIDPGDVIKVGLIYKPGVVQPVGDFAILDGTVDPTFDTSLHRPALAQTFQEIATDGRFTVIVNHLKSKGCTGATGLNADQGDGQSCWNLARTEAANALINWALSDPTGAGDPDFLIMGDLNSYAKEDPIAALEAAGYTNLETLFEGDDAYSYVFFAQAGSLDHNMASASLTPQVSGATTWHINADEPSVLDYNVEFKTPNHVNLLYNADPYRTSDHDPVLIGLNLTPVEASIRVTKTVGTDPSVCAATSHITVPAGSTVYYCYTVTNTSDVTLNLHDLVDDQLGTIFAGLNYPLIPGGSVSTVAAGLSIPAVIRVPTTNVATWTAYNAGGALTTAEASAFVDVIYFSCQNPVENFEGGVPPLGWGVVNNVAGGPEWTDLTGCGQAGNYTGGAGDVACMSPGATFEQSYDAELRTPVFSLVGYSDANFSYLANYQNWAGIDQLDLDISTDGGATWATLRSWNSDQGAFQNTPGVFVNIDLAAYLGMDNLMLRWHYYIPSGISSLGWYAQVDQAEFTCVQIPPTAVTLDGLSAVPAPAAGLPLAALPAMVSLALGAAYALRRKE